MGFEWSDVHGAIEKLDEEIAEFKAEVRSNACLQADTTTEGQHQHERLAAELGDVLFCVVNVCRYLKIDPEQALKRTNASFERRFRYVERGLPEQGKTRSKPPWRKWTSSRARESRRTAPSRLSPRSVARLIQSVTSCLTECQGSFMEPQPLIDSHARCFHIPGSWRDQR